MTDSGGFQAFSLGAMISHGIRKVGNVEVKTKPDPKLKNGPIGQKIYDEKTLTVKRKGVLLSKIREDGVEFTLAALSVQV